MEHDDQSHWIPPEGALHSFCRDLDGVVSLRPSFCRQRFFHSQTLFTRSRDAQIRGMMKGLEISLKLRPTSPNTTPGPRAALDAPDKNGMACIVPKAKSSKRCSVIIQAGGQDQSESNRFLQSSPSQKTDAMALLMVNSKSPSCVIFGASLFTSSWTPKAPAKFPIPIRATTRNIPSSPRQSSSSPPALITIPIPGMTMW